MEQKIGSSHNMGVIAGPSSLVRRPLHHLVWCVGCLLWLLGPSCTPATPSLCEEGQTRPCQDASLCGAGTQTCKDGVWLPCAGATCRADQKCSEGQCACLQGQVDCQSQCADLNTSPAHCGACGKACPAGQACLQGTCIGGCPSGTPDACGNACVNLQQNPQFCGDCSTSCQPGQLCAGGICRCPPGQLLCGSQCIDPNANSNHCGGCGNACTDGTLCASGRCQASCPPATPETCAGGCVDFQQSVAHCGACGRDCPADQLCQGGACACPQGLTSCAGRCLDRQIHPQHCGACGNVCPAGQLCAAGRCVSTCPTSTPTVCFGGCVDLQNNRLHCGKCGGACPYDQICQGNLCQCPKGQSACGGRCVDTQIHPLHCGRCHNPCPTGQACLNGTCGQAPCTDGRSRKCYNSPASTEGVGPCKAGTQTCAKGKWGDCVGEIGPRNEACNGLDDNCDGKVDEGCECVDGRTRKCYGGPQDTANVGQCKEGTQTCQSGKWSACVGQILPKQEVCNDNKDEDCDGTANEGCSCINGQTRICYNAPSATKGVGACKTGTQTCQEGKWGACSGQVLPKSETCNNKDDNCDGVIDGQKEACYSGPANTKGVGICEGGIRTCRAGSWGACVGEVKPRGDEVCNGKDDNCDGRVDEGLPRVTYYRDSDGDFYGDPTRSIKRCAQNKPTGYVTNNTDCDDTRATINPMGSEICNGKDDDCDGRIDSFTRPCYSGLPGTRSVGACKDGSQTCDRGRWSACSGEVLPKGESCNGVDDDCNGKIDDTQPPCILLPVTTGSTNGDYLSKIVADSQGNVYVAGQFSGAISFGTFSPPGSLPGSFVAKMDAKGKWLWAKFLQDSNRGSADFESLAVDGAGKVWVVGRYRRSPNIGGTILPAPTSPNFTGALIAQINAAGSWAWAKSLASTQSVVALDVALTTNSQAYVVGYFTGDLQNGSNTIRNEGSTDAFISRRDSKGNAIWNMAVGGTSADRANAVAVDAQGYALLTGSFTSYMSFSQTLSIQSSGSSDTFIAKLGANQGWEWAEVLYTMQVPGQNGDALSQGNDIATDSQGNAYVLGSFRGILDYGTTNATATAQNDLYVAFFDSKGKKRLIRTLHSNADLRSGGLVHHNGALYISGRSSTKSNITLSGPQLNGQSNTLPMNATGDVWVAKLTGSISGGWSWGWRVSFPAGIMDGRVSLDVGGSLYLGGTFTGNKNFQRFGLSSKGDEDLFVLKLVP